MQPTADSLYVGVDVGGTNIKVGVVTDQGRPLSHVTFPTEARRGPDAGLQRIFQAIDRALAEAGLALDDIRAIGVAMPGTMDIPAGMLLEPPNLPGWVNVPVRRIVADRCGKPTVFQNDANAGAWGEYWVGAGRDVRSLVLWTLGTGVGCGIIYDDAILQGAHSHGSESGHMIIQMDGGRLLPGTGQYGTLEAYAGANAIVARCREALDTGRPSLLRDRLARQRAGAPPAPHEKDAGAAPSGNELTPLLIARAAEAGDELADEIIMETARCLGVATTSLMHTIDPALVLFGGGMTFGRDDTDLGRRFIQRIRDEVRARAFPVPAAKTRIEYATLGSDAGFIGAAGCAWREHHS